MKILLAQINPTVGALAHNRDMIIGIIREHSKDADIIVFPELALTGYPPGDLLLESHFIQQLENTLTDILGAVTSTVVILGTIRRSGRQLFNSAAILQGKKIIGFRDKTLLPTYDVFDEDRYFTPAVIVENITLTISGQAVKLGIEICEDLWDREYPQKVSSELFSMGADMVINISASPYCVGKFNERLRLVTEKVAIGKKWFLYCNLVGAQDELIFDGRSFAVNPDGALTIAAKQFDTDMLWVDTKASYPHSVPSFNYWEEEVFSALTLGVRDYFRKTGFKTAILGLSGGIDSALTCAIAANALGVENVMGISMPSPYSSGHSILDARQLAGQLGILFYEMRIDCINRQFLEALDPVFADTPSGLAEENLQARIRGNILMAVANKIHGLVLNTGNKTEVALGYCTLYGDMCGAIGVISDLNKVQVYQISRWYNASRKQEVIPESTLNKPPSAELKPDQVDPFDYDEVSPLVDEIINDHRHLNYLVQKGYDETLARDMLEAIRMNEYKRRQAAPGLKVSAKAFGLGRRYPIVNGFKD